jgi:septal ring factor EnvC (AmiA/AmiB activator)
MFVSLCLSLISKLKSFVRQRHRRDRQTMEFLVTEETLEKLQKQIEQLGSELSLLRNDVSRLVNMLEVADARRQNKLIRTHAPVPVFKSSSSSAAAAAAAATAPPPTRHTPQSPVFSFLSTVFAPPGCLKTQNYKNLD